MAPRRRRFSAILPPAGAHALTLSEAASFLGSSPSTLRRQIAAGDCAPTTSAPIIESQPPSLFAICVRAERRTGRAFSTYCRRKSGARSTIAI